MSRSWDSNSKVNKIIQAYIAIFRLYIGFTNVEAQKIDRSIFLTYYIVLKSFKLEDKEERIYFFQKTFLVANIALKVIL